MEISNIMVLNARPGVIKNIPLHSLLFRQCPSARERVDIVFQLIIDYIYGENEEGALESLGLLWPSILETTVLGSDGLRPFTAIKGKEAATLYSLDLSKEGAAKLDAALLMYAKHLDDLILRTFAWLKSGLKVPEAFIESASKEMIRATHIMSDSKSSGD